MSSSGCSSADRSCAAGSPSSRSDPCASRADIRAVDARASAEGRCRSCCELRHRRRCVHQAVRRRADDCRFAVRRSTLRDDFGGRRARRRGARRRSSADVGRRSSLLRPTRLTPAPGVRGSPAIRGRRAAVPVRAGVDRRATPSRRRGGVVRGRRRLVMVVAAVGAEHDRRASPSSLRVDGFECVAGGRDAARAAIGSRGLAGQSASSAEVDGLPVGGGDGSSRVRRHGRAHAGCLGRCGCCCCDWSPAAGPSRFHA